jgi:hypothetical protein
MGSSDGDGLHNSFDNSGASMLHEIILATYCEIAALHLWFR